MATTIFNIVSDSWTKITNGESSGSYLSIGIETVYIYQGSTPPTGEAGSVPIMDSIASPFPRPYFGLGDENLYARTVSGTTTIHVTPGS